MSRLWGRAAVDVFLPHPRVLSIVSCQAPGGVGRVDEGGAQPSHPPLIEDDPPYVPSKGWAKMIRKVYEVDPLLCPSWGGRMRIISFINELKTIDRIIRYLELTFEAERPPPPHNVQQELLMAAEERKDYF